MTHHDRATEHVTLWIINDGDYYDRARDLAPSPQLLGEYLTLILEDAKEQSAPWHVRRDISANELDAIDWRYVAGMLLVE